MRLLRATPRTMSVAFADQDDVWLPGKLARGVAALATVPADVPALYCARQYLVDEQLMPLKCSPRLRRPPGFPASLTQNIATGCTVMLNPAAASLVAGSEAPPGSLHDWWCYLVITAAGGRVLADDTPTVLYRQHGSNAVGAPHSMPRRAYAALRRGPRDFMGVFRAHVSALRAQPGLLSAEARETLDRIDAALRQGQLTRLRALGLAGMRRQTWLETALFRWWFLVG